MRTFSNLRVERREFQGPETSGSVGGRIEILELDAFDGHQRSDRHPCHPDLTQGCRGRARAFGPSLG